MAPSGQAASAVAAADKELHELLSDLGELLCELVGSSDVGPSALESSGRFWHLYHQLKQRHNESLSVALLALAKSGKSTLVNALLGDELMPVSNVPETARICRVTHAPAAACPAPRLERPPAPSADADGAAAAPAAITGAAAISAALRALNAEARGGSNARAFADERLLDITAPLVALEEGDGEGGAAAGVAPGTRLCLLDTPGPNEAGEEGLRFQVERLLCGVDAAVYLLDYTKLKTAEEASMLGRLRSLNPELVRRLCTRLFFAVNKFDQAETAGGLGAEETREYVAQEVTRQLALPGFSLHPDQVLIISARDALLSRLILSNRATPDAASRFAHAAFGPIGARSMERQPPAARAEAARSAASDMLRASGVPELEARVLAFLYENSAGLKLMATLDDAGRLLAEVHNAASACCASLAADAEEVAASRDALSAELAAMMGDFDGVARAAEELEVEVVDELRAHLANLRIRLFQHISDAFDERRTRAESASAGGVAGRWSAVRRRFAALFGGGGAESRDEVGSALLELHDEVTAQIEADVAEAWHVMESATNARARALAAALTDALERLTLRVEGAVEAQLDVQLEPVSLRMEAPTREAFHADLQALIDNGISEVPERHVRVAERTEMTWELRRRGVCRMSSYWVQVPRTHRVVETYTSVSYNLDPQAVRDQFMQAVDSAILTTERSLPPYVREFVRRQVEAARRQAQDYGDSYLASMRTALEASTAGADVRAAALSRVTAQCDAAAALRGRLSALAGRVETLVPHNASVGMFEQLEWPSEDGEGDEAAAADARPAAARDQAGPAAVALALAASGGAVAAIATEVAAVEKKQKAPAAGGEDDGDDAAATKDAAAAPAGDATSDAAAAEAEAVVAEEEAPPAPAAAAAGSRRASSSSSSFGSCAELSTDEVGEARAADLAASGLLAMRPLPAAPSPAQGAPIDGPRQAEEGAEQNEGEEEESAESRRMAGVGQIAALAAAAAAPAQQQQQQEEAAVPAPPAPPSSVTDPLSSFEEVLSPTATVVSSGGANERLADSLLGGDASGDASDAGDAPAAADPADALSGVPPALPLSSSAHGSALGAGSAAGSGGRSLSIVPHAEDGADGAPADGAGSPTLDFRRSFAEALTAAGLPGVPPPGSTDSSDDWSMVEGVAAELEREGGDAL